MPVDASDNIHYHRWKNTNINKKCNLKKIKSNAITRYNPLSRETNFAREKSFLRK